MKTPLVSVVMPVFNQELFVAEALDSIIEQSYPAYEVVIVDDGSNDTSLSICQEYQRNDSRFRVFSQRNKGPAAARNEAILQARGDYICLLDSDDRMDPKRIEHQLRPFLQDQTIDVVYTSVLLIDKERNFLGEIKGESLPSELFRAEMFFRNLLPGPGLMAKRTCFIQEPYDPSFVHAEDYELMLRFLRHFRFFYLDEPLTLYRRHTTNLSENRPAHRAAEKRALDLYSQAFLEKVVSSTSLSLSEKELLLGKILFNKECFHDALEILKKSSSPLSLFYQGNCHYFLDQLVEAKRCYETSLDLDARSNPACYNNLALLSIKEEDKKSALRLLKKALHLKKDYLDASSNLACLLKGHPFPPKFTFKELRSHLIPYTYGPKETS